MGRLIRGMGIQSDAPLARHSLLEDLYGQDGFSGELRSSKPVLPAEQLLRLRIGNLVPPWSATPSGNPAMRSPNHFAGSVITVISDRSGEIATSRIIGSQFDEDSKEIEITCVNFAALPNLGSAPPQSGYRVVVNGRPFDGAGAGFDRTSRQLSKTNTFNLQTGQDEFGSTPTVEVRVSSAILNNHSPFTIEPPRPDPDDEAKGEYLTERSLDESYDAADFQNMFLSWGSTLEPTDVIPSFHRPSIVKYLEYLVGTQGKSIDVNDGYEPGNDKELDRLLSAAIFRPSKIHHPLFRGGNPKADLPLGFDPINGPWDIDNDGDGLADSIWLDLGDTPMTDNLGRRFKPLYAVQCIDLDGRLNLNAHGSIAHWLAPYSQKHVPASNIAGASDTSVQIEVRGSGFGPADINLARVSKNGSPLITRSLVEERYRDASTGELGPGTATKDDNRSTSPQSHHYESLGYPLTNHLDGDTVSLFMSPLDMYGQNVTMLDHLGQPLVFFFDDAPANGTTDDPYETSLSHLDGTDALYTIADLEPILRQLDTDASMLSPRLLSVMTDETAAASSRSIFTTDSYDLPVTNDKDIDRQLVELLEQKVAVSANPREVLSDWRALIPREVRLGGKLDLNRPFGDGVDNNSNWIVDEPEEPDTFRSFPSFDSTLAARQDYARELYILLMFLNELSPLFDDELVNADIQLGPEEQTAIAIAQWAVNVVDFRDSDSIMTPLEIDPDLSDGWQSDGDITTVEDGIVVWGCERPELLITETLAWHDRRTEDLDGFQMKDESGEWVDNQLLEPRDPNTPRDQADRHPDQRLLPQGACFVELFNPWSSPALRQPIELYGDGGIDLTRQAGNSAVWRLYFTDAVDTDPDLANLNMDGTLKDVGNDHRLVYFLPPNVDPLTTSPQTPPTDNHRAFYSTRHSGRPILPNTYAVVGSGGTEVEPDRFVSIIGFASSMIFDTDASKDLPLLIYEDQRRVELLPRASSRQVRLEGLSPTGLWPGQPGDSKIRENLAFVVDQMNGKNGRTAANFTLSHPLGSSTAGQIEVREYPKGETTTQFMERHLQTPDDHVLDPLPLPRFSDQPNPSSKTRLSQTKTYSSYRVVHLQRLANPTQPFDRLANPYRTVDSAFVDLTSFNGVNAEDFGWEIPLPPARPNYIETSQGVRFFANQRGDASSLGGRFGVAGEPFKRNLWRREPRTNDVTQSSSSPNTATDSKFSFNLRSTLGYLNHGYGPPITRSGPYKGAPATKTLSGQQDPPGPPFPWFPWNNRPFASTAELLSVPRSSSSLLTRDYSVGIGGDGYGEWDSHPFRHLLNFFGNAPNGQDHKLHRLFDYVSIASRFRGDRVWLRDRPDPDSPIVGTPGHAISSYRDAGRVNLNTIADPAVWEALVADTTYDNQDQTADQKFFDFLSARGDVRKPDLPTQFSNPFRGFGANSLMPILDGLNETRLTNGRAIDATLFRMSPDREYPFLIGATTSAHNDSQRNPFFAHQALQRLQAVTTTHSNVFAVWITVGYFEVVPWTTDEDGKYDPHGKPTVDLAHPDGLMLGEELGTGSGEITRHRGFYVIDRSIPVAFEPGEDHNTGDTIILRRFIE